MQKIKWTLNQLPKSADSHLEAMSLAHVSKAIEFHKSFPQYSVTPLANLSLMAEALGLRGFFVKDESFRFGLNAFKVLGGSFAIAKTIAKELDRDVSTLNYAYLKSDQLKSEFGQATFFTATDGNHGRGVAWSARELGQKAIVKMPKGTVSSRFDNIVKEGATVTIEALNYDDCVRMAAAQAADTPRSVMVQDTAWEGYTEIPTWIMQGYGTMALEAAQQLKAAGFERPTHIFLQAGVGSMAGAVAGVFANLYPEHPPTVVVMEATVADCHYQSALRGDGSTEAVTGDLSTMMAGLACGEVNILSWDILRNHAAAFVSCPDWVAAKGMRMLAAPIQTDPRVTSGESGAVGMGMVSTLMLDADYIELKAALGLNADSVVLTFSTEGDTDPENYRNIVWNGAVPSNKE